MIDLSQVAQPGAKRLADRLLTEADTKDALGRRVLADKRKQDSRLFGNAGPRREEDLVEPVDLLERDLVIAPDLDRGAQRLQDVI